MNPRAPQRVTHFGEVALSEVFDLRGFNLNAKLEIDPDFLEDGSHDIAGMERVVELRNRTPIHRDRLILEPCPNLLFFKLWPSGETISQQLGLAGDSGWFWHGQYPRLYSDSEAQTIPNSNRKMTF
jgi:hypothetical protein